jgi:hypothetical protein
MNEPGLFLKIIGGARNDEVVALKSVCHKSRHDFTVSYTDSTTLSRLIQSKLSGWRA